MRPKRFSRSSYARRASSLASDLDEWTQYYRWQLEDARPGQYAGLQLARMSDRVGQLNSIADELEYLALRIRALS